MNPRPILRMLPMSLSERLFYRFFNANQKRYAHLFSESVLRLAPKYKMTGLKIGDVISGQIAFNGFYEYDLSKEILEYSKTGGLFVDVGANIGYFTLLWLSGNVENKAVAFEASPRNKTLLKNNLEANSVENRVQVISKAAGNEHKKILFDLGPEEQTGWGGIVSGNQEINSTEVEMVRIDEIITEPIEVMKIDVEGADTLVIYGCEKLLEQQKIKRIFFEQNSFRMKKLGIKDGEAQTYLKKFGYKCKQIGNEEWLAEKS